MIKAVIFDMYETLVTLYESPVYFSYDMAADIGMDVKQFREPWHASESDRTLGKETPDQVIERILKDNNRFDEALMKMISDKRRACKQEVFNHLHKDIIPMLEGLKKQNIKIGLISNCYQEEAEVIRESILFQYFTEVILSCEEHIKKPDQEIFKRAMRRLMVEPHECLYIGDGGSHELEAATEAGMNVAQAVWYLKEGTLQPAQRKEEFTGAFSPMDILELIKC